MVEPSMIKKRNHEWWKQLSTHVGRSFDQAVSHECESDAERRSYDENNDKNDENWKEEISSAGKSDQRGFQLTSSPNVADLHRVFVKFVSMLNEPGHEIVAIVSDQQYDCNDARQKAENITDQAEPSDHQTCRRIIRLEPAFYQRNLTNKPPVSREKQPKNFSTVNIFVSGVSEMKEALECQSINTTTQLACVCKKTTIFFCRFSCAETRNI